MRTQLKSLNFDPKVEREKESEQDLEKRMQRKHCRWRGGVKLEEKAECRQGDQEKPGQKMTPQASSHCG